MSRMKEEEARKGRRARRAFTAEFKAGAVRLVLDEGKSIAQVARDLDLTATSGSFLGQDRPDHRGARRAGEAPQRESRAPDGTGDPKKSRGLLRERECMRFAFIKKEKATYPVTALCRALAVSRAGFYAWFSRPESERDREDRRLAALIEASHEGSRRTYGSPRVHADLIAGNERVGKKRVARIMRLKRLKARVRRRYKSTTMSEHDQPIAPNLLARRFEAAYPNQRWVTDTTELLAGSGKLYLAAVLDLYSRLIVGWSVSAVNDRHLTLQASALRLHRRLLQAEAPALVSRIRKAGRGGPALLSW